MTSLSTNQQTAVSKAVAQVAYFVELHFSSGVVRVCTYSYGKFTWGGYDWIGLGSIGNITPIEESAQVVSAAMMFTLNIAQVSVLALALADASTYRGGKAILYFCPLNPDGTLIDTPVVGWRGNMDTMGIGVDGAGGQITLRCETSAFSIKRRTALRLNAAQQAQRMVQFGLAPDNGFKFLTNLIAKPQLWLSKKFQMI
jgi:hypothetical protein